MANGNSLNLIEQWIAGYSDKAGFVVLVNEYDKLNDKQELNVINVTGCEVLPECEKWLKSIDPEYEREYWSTNSNDSDDQDFSFTYDRIIIHDAENKIKLFPTESQYDDMIDMINETINRPSFRLMFQECNDEDGPREIFTRISIVFVD